MEICLHFLSLEFLAWVIEFNCYDLVCYLLLFLNIVNGG